MKRSLGVATAGTWIGVALTGACGASSGTSGGGAPSEAPGVSQQRAYVRSLCEFTARCGVVGVELAAMSVPGPCNHVLSSLDVADCIGLYGHDGASPSCDVEPRLFETCAADLKTLRCVTQEELDTYCAKLPPRAESPDSAIWPVSCKKIDERLRSPECGGPGEPDGGSGPTTLDGGK